jgi:hypothetical protein
MKRHLLTVAAAALMTTAAALAPMMTTTAKADSPFNVGQTITFRNPFKTGCPTPEIANKVRHGAVNMAEGEAQSCFKLIAGRPYQIAEVRRYDGEEFYRVPLSNGDFVWTYILSRDVESAGIKLDPQNRAIANATLIMKMTAMVMNGELYVYGPNKATLSGSEPTATVTRPNPDDAPCVYEIEDGRGNTTRVDFNRISEEYRLDQFGFTLFGAPNVACQNGQCRDNLPLIGRLDDQFIATLRFVWNDSNGKCSPAKRVPASPKF